MTVIECEYFVGSHHCGPIQIGLPDDGFGNAIYEKSKIFDTVIGVSALQKLAFIWSD